MRRLSKDRATAGLQRRQKAGEFLFRPLDRATWRRYDGGTMNVGEVDQLFLCNGPSSGSQNQCYQRLARRSRAWPGLRAPLLTAAGQLRGTPSSARRGHTGHLADLQPLQIGLLHAGRGIRGPTATRLGHRQPPAAACRGIIRHLVQRHAHGRDPRGPPKSSYFA